MATTQSPATSPAPVPPKASTKKRALIGVGGVLGVILLIVLLLPTLLSTGTGNAFLLGKVNAGIAGTVKADAISLGWFGGQSITGLQVLDPDSNTVVSIDKIDIPGVGLLSLATGGRNLGTITVTKPIVNFKQNADGTSNLDAAFAAKKASKSKSAGGAGPASGPFVFPEKKLSFTLNVIDGEVSAEGPSLPSTRIDSFVLQVVMPSIASIDVKTSAKISQGNHQGQWSVNLNLADLFAADGTIQTDKLKLAGDADVSGVPIDVVDTMAKQEGKLTALLGAKLDAKIKADGTLANLKADVDVTSENLAIKTNVTSTDTGVVVAPGTKATLIVTELAWEKLNSKPNAPADSKLKKPFSIELVINKFTLPMVIGKADVANAAIDTRVSLTDITLVTPAPVGEVSLHGASVSAKSDNLRSKELKVVLAASAEQAGRKGKIDLTAALNNAFDADGKFNLAGVAAKVNGAITQLPLAVVDELSKSDGLLTKSLGATLNATLIADIAPASGGGGLSGPFSLTADSGTPGVAGQPLIVALNGEVASNTLTLNDGSNVTYTLQPALVALLASGKSANGKTTAPAYSLTQPSVLKVTFNSVSLPLESAKLGNAAMNLTVSLARVDLHDSGTLGDFSLSDTSINIATAKLADKITLKANSQLAQGTGRSASITADGSATGVIGANGKPSPETAAVDLDAKVTNLPTSIIDLFAQKPGQPANRAQAALGPMINITVGAKSTPLTASGKAGVPAGSKTDFSITAKSDSLDLKSGGELTPTQFSLGADATLLTFTLTPDAARVLANQKDKTAGAPAGQLQQVLASPSVLTLKVPTLIVPLPFKDASSIKAALSLAINEIVPAEAALPPDLKGTRLSGIELKLPEAMMSDTLTPTFVASLSTPYDAKPIPLSASVTVKDAAKETRKVDAKAQLDHIPVSLIDALAKQKGKLLATLGPTLTTMKLTASQPTPDSYNFTANIDSAKLHTDFGATYTPGQLLDVRVGSSISLSLSPEAYAAIAPKETAGGMTLAGDAPTKVTFRETQIVWKPGTVAGEDGKIAPVIDANKSLLGIDFTASASFNQVDPALTHSINDLLITLDAASLGKKLDIRIQGTASTAGASIPGGKKSSKISSNTTLTSAFGDDLKFAGNTAVIDSKTSFPELPVAALDAILRKNGDLLDLLGDTASLVLTIQRHPDTGGPVELELKSGNLNVNAKADIDKNQNVKLREDAIAMVTVTPKIATKYLAKISPVLKDVKSAKDPVKLTLKKDRFFYPLNDPDVSNRVVIGSLDLGVMHMQRGEVGGYLVKAMREVGSSIQDREEFDAVFTRLDFTMEKGVVTSNDVWFDAGDVILGTQARVNIAANPADPTTEVLMGIPGELVRLIPGAAKRVPATALYEITGAGPLSKISYDYMAMSTEFAKIAAEATGNKTVSQIAGGLSVASQVGSALFGDKEKKENAAKGIKGWDGATWPNRPKPNRAPAADAAGAATGAAAAVPAGQPAPANSAAPAATPAPSVKEDVGSALMDALKNATSKETPAAKPAEKPAAAKPKAPEAETIAPAPTPTPAPAHKPAAAPEPAPAPVEKPKAKSEPAPVERPKAKAEPVEKPKPKTAAEKKAEKKAEAEAEAEAATTAPAEEPVKTPKKKR